jgi:N-methylhydantoinase A/oxoprolinase/acetone carboxylase beta subunit
VPVGIDVGGTFTDLVTDTGDVAKVLSTPGEPATAVRDALASAGIAEGTPDLLAHGTTVATNALLERALGTVALVATRGFADVIEIARQTRPSLYDPHVDRPPPLVPRELRLEVAGRLGGDGREVEPYDGRVPEIASAVDAVAVCLLHADLDDAHERAVAAALAARGLDVVVSSAVSPEFREYERMVTTVVNAGLRPVCAAYLRELDRLAREVLVMTSAGGLVPTTVASEVPAALLLSGPAAGVRAAASLATSCGFPDAVSFDMGGTSTDVCLVRGGVPDPSPALVVDGYPVRLPALGVHTIGAGGGSIARIDAGGALAVGPRSAGALPGPVCYGRGGTEPTVTDADLVLGRIAADAAFAGLGTLDRDAAVRALERAGIDAAGVVSVVDAAMEQAVRAVTVEQGVDPRDLALVAFGGAGPLHACAVAGALGMRAVLVPPRAGVFSAVGLVSSPRTRELVRTWRHPRAREGLDRARAQLAREAADLVGRGTDGGVDVDPTVETFVDCRYAGQSHEITVPTPSEFPAEHERRNGFTRPGAPVEVVSLRARAARPAPLGIEALPAVARARVRGPRVVVEPDCTVWVADGWAAEPGPDGAWILEQDRR